MSRILHIVLLLVPVALKLLGIILKTPEADRKELLGRIGAALKKAEDEKDPSDLSRIINE